MNRSHGMVSCAVAAACLAVSLRDLPAQDEPEQETMRALLERHAVDHGSLLRRHDVPMSPARRARLERFFGDWLAQLERVEFGGLDRAGKVDHVLFGHHLRHAVRELAREAALDREVEPLVPFWRLVVDLAEARRAMDPVDPPDAARRLDELAREVERLRDALDPDAGDTQQTVAWRAAGRVADLRRALQRWFRFYDGYDPLFSWWARAPHARAARALSRYETAIREQLVGARPGEDPPIVGDPIGRQALLDALEHQMIAYTPEELIAIAERELAWCERERARAARDLGFGDDWRRALDHVKDLHVPPGKQPELIRDLAHEAVRFLEDRDLLTIPELCKETWRIEMMSPERQKVNPYFTGGETISVSFPTDEMDHADKLMSLRGNNIHFSRATVHHELIPGHHLQQFMTARHATWRRIFHTPFWLEGWALYWELRLWDLGFPRSAEDRIGMLFWRTHRCARIVFSLRFHLGEMSAREAIDYLVERVGHEPRNATAEVRRSVAGGYGPLYQAAYMLGGLQLRALHGELVASGSMTERAFHDAVLRQNSIPIEMVRAALTDVELTPDWRASWRFCGDR